MTVRIRDQFADRNTGIGDTSVRLGKAYDRINSELFELCITACSKHCPYLNSVKMTSFFAE